MNLPHGSMPAGCWLEAATIPGCRQQRLHSSGVLIHTGPTWGCVAHSNVSDKRCPCASGFTQKALAARELQGLWEATTNASPSGPLCVAHLIRVQPVKNVLECVAFSATLACRHRQWPAPAVVMFLHASFLLNATPPPSMNVGVCRSGSGRCRLWSCSCMRLSS